MADIRTCPDCQAEHDLDHCRADATMDACDCCRAIVRDLEAAGPTEL